MGSFSDYLELELLDHIHMKGAFTAPTKLFVGLSTADPLDTGAGVAEPSGGAYARVLTTATHWSVAAAGATSNAAAITFAEATAAWGTISHFVIYDTLTGGNLIEHAALTVSKGIGIGDTASFAIGELDVTLD